MREMQIFVAVQQYTRVAGRPHWTLGYAHPDPCKVSPEIKYAIEEIVGNNDVLLWSFQLVEQLSEESTKIVTLDQYVSDASAAWAGPTGFVCNMDETSNIS